jgi:5-methylcytosine-specific restriction endonuclease McrA
VERKRYQEYMQSDKWKHRRSKYFETHERKCRACSSTARIQLHHKTYVRLEKERDQDLVALCWRCHNSLHKIQRKTRQNLWSVTEDFIRKKRQKIKNIKTTRRPTAYNKKRRRKNVRN